MAKHYKFISPNGVIHDVYGKFKLFCIEHKLTPAVMTHLLVGKTIKKHHKGWQVFYLDNFSEDKILHINPLDFYKKFSKESIEILISTRKGKHLSESHKKKISENHSRAGRKLTDKQVKEIKKLISEVIITINISKLFDMPYQIIYRIKTGKTWKNISIK